MRGRGILFCLDAIQTLGAFPTTVEQVDFLAADAHKWLLGPCGAGLLYVRREIQDRMNPPIYGWHNVRCPNFVAQEQIVFRNGAAKYEAGTHNLLGLVGLIAALELTQDMGVEHIAAETGAQTRVARARVAVQRIYSFNAEAKVENISGITSFHQAGKDLAGLHKKLTEAGVVTSLRADRKGQTRLRLSPHFYNTDAELHRLLELL